ncbi:mechanosensitive ion channel family protein [Halopseudomonas salina]|uniref:Small-conductance mechanosensitive channel n=1 Tax=Halopseudomonas salina TaxID=1323744 RepID=A0ABQ1PDS7_9GAMM|nr:mechanosensitive ion channel family protein [Halopseudomonas salina]GGC95219.1 mechanosensitive ion channel protein MscS [Halopseudomonas salina]
MVKPLVYAILCLFLWLPGSVNQALAQDSAETAAIIQVTDVPSDTAIRERLQAVLAALDGGAAIEVGVEQGVVTLKGNVPNARSARELEGIANRVEGVIHVQSRLTEETDVSARVRPATRKFQEMGAAAVQMLPVVLVALVVVVAFWLLGRWAGSRGAWLRRIGLSELASNLGKRIVRLAITGLGILIALEILDATALVGAMLGVAGVAGIAVGFAFRNIVENYLAGVLLSARNPFDVGDVIEVGTFTGTVVRLTSRDTVLMTRDGNHLRIPNSMIITSAMTNFTRNPLRRLEFVVGVSVDLDLQQARQLGIETLQAMTGILADPGPQVLVAELGDSTVQLRFLAWINQHDSDFLKARSEAIRQIKAAYDKAGIEMPEPIYRIHLRNPSAIERSTEPSDRPPEAAQQKPALVTPTRAEDVAADNTIDRQVAAELRSSDEENLLTKT